MTKAQYALTKQRRNITASYTEVNPANDIGLTMECIYIHFLVMCSAAPLALLFSFYVCIIKTTTSSRTDHE